MLSGVKNNIIRLLLGMCLLSVYGCKKETPPPSVIPTGPSGLSILPSTLEAGAPAPTIDPSFINGPMTYPTPSKDIVPWLQLVESESLAYDSWAEYQGEIQGVEKSDLWGITFRYPQDWVPTTRPSPQHLSVQNIPESQGSTQAEFVKFEIARLIDPPFLDSGEVMDPALVKTVLIAADPGVMYMMEDEPDRIAQISVVFQHQGAWLAAAGYIALPAQDAVQMQRFLAIFYEMFSSIAWVE